MPKVSKQGSLFDEEQKNEVNSLFVLYNEEPVQMTLAEIFDTKSYNEFYAISYVASPRFFANIIKGFKSVNFILGINNIDTLNKFTDGFSSYLDNSPRVKFFNDLPNDTKELIIANNVKIRYGKPGVMIHDKIYLLSNKEANDYRVIVGSANLSNEAFDFHNQNFENIRIDDSKKLYDIYMERFNYIFQYTNDYIPERCREKYEKKKALVLVNDDAKFDLLLNELEQGRIPVVISQEQMDVMYKRNIQIEQEKEDLATAQKLVDLVVEKKNKAGTFKFRKLDHILKKKVEIKNAYRKASKLKAEVEDSRETLLMSNDYKLYRETTEEADDGSKIADIYSKKISTDKIRSTLEKIHSFTQAYSKFTLTPSPIFSSKIYEFILYSFTTPFIWKIRNRCSMIYDKAAVADVPMFCILGGTRESGKSTALLLTARLLGQSADNVYDYARDLDKADALYPMITSNNLMPILADEVSLSFFRRQGNTRRKGEDMIKSLANSVPEEPIGTMIGTTNASDFSSSGQVVRRIYYIEVSNKFDSARKAESMAYLRNIYDGLDDALFRDFTYKFAEAIRNNEEIFDIEDYLLMTRKIFWQYYEETGLEIPDYFPLKIFRDYEDRKVDTWRRFFFANKAHFIDESEMLKVEIDEIFKNSNNKTKQKETLLNFLDESCLATDSTIGVHWFLKKEAFYKFIDYTPTVIENAKSFFGKWF